jgi:uncharacterized YigZ family protein
MPDASHHVYAFRAGYGNSITEGMSDDGEPSGSGGPPMLSVLRGADIGDICAVVTRYFGGTKLGIGGLVRAYTEAVQTGLTSLKTEYNIIKKTLGFEVPYPLHDVVKRLIQKHDGEISDTTFSGEITFIIEIPADQVIEFQDALTELTAGQVSVIPFD